ncbi:MAG: 2-amino-4-hydroxy-6-hydroxymethyldihydropteridine diphosphokinase [Flavobacteriales bacterium]
MKDVYLLLGSNMGDSAGTLDEAASLIEEQLGRITRKSSLYKTEAWGMDGRYFLNQALVLSTQLDVQEVLSTCKKTERLLGRKSRTSSNWEPRTIDIDILMYAELHTESSELTVPHRALPMRRFALVPLAEIAGRVIHPVFKKSIAEMLRACDDQHEVEMVI